MFWMWRSEEVSGRSGSASTSAMGGFFYLGTSTYSPIDWSLLLFLRSKDRKRGFLTFRNLEFFVSQTC